jgi:hypothetical protein
VFLAGIQCLFSALSHSDFGAGALACFPSQNAKMEEQQRVLPHKQWLALGIYQH